MKVHIIRKASIQQYVHQNARSKSSLAIFQKLIKVANWTVPEDIKRTFASKADIICSGGRIVFDVGGGTYRVICGLKFGKKAVYLYLKSIGTHAEYDRLCNARKNEIGVCNIELYK